MSTAAELYVSDEGASSVEYGLIVVAIAAVVVLVVVSFGGTVQNLFTDSCGKLTEKIQTSQSCP
jgi:Flp pilus assembly pilin Flp